MTTFWAAAQTYPRFESIAVRNLRRQNFSCFFPFFLTRNRYRHYAVHPAFPGYIFIELDHDTNNWSPINSTVGVIRLLTMPTRDEYLRPCVVDFVDDLRRLRICQPDRPEADILPLGTMVRIKSGPLAEKTALVEMATRERVRLLVQLFNREIAAEFSVNDLETMARPLSS